MYCLKKCLRRHLFFMYCIKKCLRRHSQKIAENRNLVFMVLWMQAGSQIQLHSIPLTQSAKLPTFMHQPCKIIWWWINWRGGEERDLVAKWKAVVNGRSYFRDLFDVENESEKNRPSFTASPWSWKKRQPEFPGKDRWFDILVLVVLYSSSSFYSLL